MAAADTDYINRAVAILAENIKRVDAGQTLVNEVDRYRGY